MIDSLVRTRPWVRFLGVLMVIGCGFLVLGGLALVALGNVAGFGEAMGGLGGASIGAAYLLMALLYFFPALYLLRYGGAIARITPTSTAAVEEALDHQASFWRFVGILAAVFLVIYVALIGVFAILAIVGAGSST